MKAMIPKGPSANEMMKQVQKMQADMQAKQAELEAKEYDISAGGGAVSIRINGKKEVLSVNISEGLVDPDDIETLQDILVAAINEAITTVEKDSETEMAKITGPLSGLAGGFPGMF